MSSGQQMLMGGGGDLINPLLPASAAYNAFSSVGIGATNKASLRLNSDGTAQYVNQSATTTTTPWAAAPVAGVGNGVWVRYTVTGGAATTNGASTFQQLSTNRDLIKGPQTNGVGSPVTFTIEFSYDGVNVAKTFTGNTLTLDFV